MSVIISPEGSKPLQPSQPHDLSTGRHSVEPHFHSGGDELNVCPRCNLPADTNQNRLVQDSCGHVKCRKCLLKEESGCFECHSINQTKRFIELKTVPMEMCYENSYGMPAPVSTIYTLRSHLDEQAAVPPQPIATEQTQPLALNYRHFPPSQNTQESVFQTPVLQRAESPELIFERVPCGRGDGGEKTVSLPFKKSLRFSKVDLNGQIHNLAGDRSFCPFNSSQKQEPIKSAEEPIVKIDSEKLTVAKRDAEEKVETVEKPPETEINRAVQKVEKTENKSKKKRGKQAVPLPSHIIVQDGGFSCDFCKRSFSSRSNVHYHASCGSTEKPFECTQCGKGFISITHYKVHIRSHSGKRPFVCVYCNKDFSQKGKLRRHMMLHTGERPYCCELCGKGFRDHNALTKHNLVHSDVRAFACDKCGKKFKELCNLNKHKVVHSKERPFVCETCGKSFGFVNALAHHKLIHTRRRDHVCKTCDKAFRLKRDLGRHMAVHAESGGLKCPQCEVHVRRKDNLERHIRNTHGPQATAASSSKS